MRPNVRAKRRAKGREAAFGFAQFEHFGQAHALRDIGCVGLLGKSEQLLDFPFQLDFEFDDVAMRECAVTRCVGVYLGAVQTHGAELEQFHLCGHFQHLNKQPRELVNEAPAKGGQGVVVGVAASGNVAKRY